MLLPSRKTQLPAYTFRSQYRPGWNLALPEEDRSNRSQMDGPILRAYRFSTACSMAIVDAISLI